MIKITHKKIETFYYYLLEKHLLDDYMLWIKDYQEQILKQKKTLDKLMKK
jgi:hypothetical protein